MKTNLGRRFLNIVDRCFPKNHPLHKIFNRHTLKLSYSCMPNMKTIISSRNKKLLSDCNQSRNSTQTLDKECNCRKKDQCPLEGKCLTSNVVYQATVTTETSTHSYVGLATNFKERYRDHTSSSNIKTRDTRLNYQSTPFNLKWKIIKQCKPYNNITKKCNLCLFEKYIIICKKDLCSLNKRNELASSCPPQKQIPPQEPW